MSHPVDVNVTSTFECLCVSPHHRHLPGLSPIPSGLGPCSGLLTGPPWVSSGPFSAHPPFQNANLTMSGFLSTSTSCLRLFSDVPLLLEARPDQTHSHLLSSLGDLLYPPPHPLCCRPYPFLPSILAPSCLRPIPHTATLVNSCSSFSTQHSSCWTPDRVRSSVKTPVALVPLGCST